MRESSDTPELTMLAARLQHLQSNGQLVVRDLAEATGCDESTIYRWLAGQSDPHFTNIQLMFKHSGSVALQAALLDLLTGGTPWHAHRVESDLDVNRDGQVDSADALKAGIESIKDIGALLEKIQEACADAQVDKKELAAIQNAAHVAIARIAASVKVVEYVYENGTGLRRKAKPVPGSNGRQKK